jgi:hypothetical protein
MKSTAHQAHELIYSLWTQGHEGQPGVVAELKGIQQRLNTTADTGGIALPGTCDDCDLPHGSTVVEAVSQALEMYGPGVQP